MKKKLLTKEEQKRHDDLMKFLKSHPVAQGKNLEKESEN